MICPKCNNDLEKQMLGIDRSIEIDVCPACKGMWFDKGELDKFDESVTVNSELADFEHVQNQTKVFDCPRCRNKLKTVKPKLMPELELDRCYSCLGFWLDKGELEDVRNMTLKMESEMVKGIDPYIPSKSSNKGLFALLMYMAIDGDD